MSEERPPEGPGTPSSAEPTPRAGTAQGPAAQGKGLEPSAGEAPSAPTPASPGEPKPASTTPAKSTKSIKEPTSNLATTRAAAAWFATGAALIVLVLLIILILQNQTVVEVKYLWFSGSLPLGTALLIAAIAGATVVMLIGIVRLTQLRINARRARKAAAVAKA